MNHLQPVDFPAEISDIFRQFHLFFGAPAMPIFMDATSPAGGLLQNPTDSGSKASSNLRELWKITMNRQIICKSQTSTISKWAKTSIANCNITYQRLLMQHYHSGLPVVALPYRGCPGAWCPIDLSRQPQQLHPVLQSPRETSTRPENLTIAAIHSQPAKHINVNGM